MQNLNLNSFFFGLSSEIPILGEFGPKNQNCHFKLKTNPNMKNSLVMLIFSISRRKHRFLGIFFHQNCLLKLKFGAFDHFEYVKSDGDVKCLCFIPIFGMFVQKIHLTFSCYLINLPAVCLQRLEAGGSFCFQTKRASKLSTFH